MDRYITVHTGTYQYVPVHNLTNKLHYSCIGMWYAFAQLACVPLAGVLSPENELADAHFALVSTTEWLR
jgi:hypothetical protein